jgi:hypothetical protein
MLDRSFRNAGPHLRSIITPDRRVSAKRLADRLVGVRVLTLATVTSDGRPITAPVDGLFYRGEFWFGSGDESLRFRHLRARPAVSATHTEGEAFAVTVHGVAHEIDTADHPGFRGYCLEVYGPAWEEWGAGVPYARIEARRMFTFEAPV